MAKLTLAQSFGKALQKQRKVKGISQEALAEKAQVHPTHIGLIERGLRNPSLNVAGARPDAGVDSKTRAEVLRIARGRCGMCGRTIERHKITLVVDRKIPGDWNGSNNIENLWAICEDCMIKPVSFKEAFLPPTAIGRVACLFRLKLKKPVPNTWLKAVAGEADWARCVRRLRSLGWKIVMSRKKDRGKIGVTHYTFFRDN